MNTKQLSLLSTAVPNAEFANKIHIACNKHFVSEFINVIEFISHKMDYNVISLKENLLNLDVNSKIHPSIFMSFYQLINSIKKGIVNEIKKSINHAIDVTNNKSIVNDFPTITSVNSESWEYDYVEKLKSYDQKNIRGEGTQIYEVSEKIMQFHIDNIEKALQMIKDADKNIYAENNRICYSYKNI